MDEKSNGAREVEIRIDESTGRVMGFFGDRIAYSTMRRVTTMGDNYEITDIEGNLFYVAYIENE